LDERSLLEIALLVASCLIASSFAASIDYAGSTVDGASWNRPETEYLSNGTLSCTIPATPLNVKFQVFNATIASPTVLRMIAMFDVDFRSDAEVLIYSALLFNPATPCAGLVYSAKSTGGSPPIYEYIQVPVPGEYTVVITSENEGGEGLFAINANLPEAMGSTFNTSRTWAPINTDETTDCTDASTSEVVNYQTFTWTQNTTGVFDFEVLLFNPLISDLDASIALYNGVFPNTTSAESTACDGSFIIGTITTGSASGYATLQSIALTSNQTYTLVVSARETNQTGTFVVFVGPTVWGDTSDSNQTFVSPSVPSTGTTPNCTLTTNLKRYQNVVFLATQPVYIIDTGSDSSYDTAVFLFRGAYTTSPPTTCDGFVYAGDTGDGGPVAVVVIPGQNYTAVVSGYSSGSGRFSLYALTGIPLGVSSTTTGSSTTGSVTAGTTGAAATTGSAASTTGSAASTTGADSTTGDNDSAAASVVASFVLAFVAAVFAF